MKQGRGHQTVMAESVSSIVRLRQRELNNHLLCFAI
jgi:hypothetical protein